MSDHRSNHYELRGLPGKNAIEQTCHLLMAHRPSFSALSAWEQIRAASAYLKEIDPGCRFLMSADKKNALADPDPKKPTIDEEHSPDAAMKPEDIELLTSLSIELQTASKAGNLEKVKAILAEIGRLTGDTEPVPTESHDQRMSAVAPYGGRNEIEKSLNFLMTSPKAPPGFANVSESRRIFAAARWFRSGQTWEDIA